MLHHFGASIVFVLVCQKTKELAFVESHLCAQNAQRWGTRRGRFGYGNQGLFGGAASGLVPTA